MSIFDESFKERAIVESIEASERIADLEPLTRRLVICNPCFDEYRYKWPAMVESVIKGDWRLALGGEPCNFCTTGGEHLGASTWERAASGAATVPPLPRGAGARVAAATVRPAGARL